MFLERFWYERIQASCLYSRTLDVYLVPCWRHQNCVCVDCLLMGIQDVLEKQKVNLCEEMGVHMCERAESFYVHKIQKGRENMWAVVCHQRLYSFYLLVKGKQERIDLSNYFPFLKKKNPTSVFIQRHRLTIRKQDRWVAFKTEDIKTRPKQTILEFYKTFFVRS